MAPFPELWFLLLFKLVLVSTDLIDLLVLSVLASLVILRVVKKYVVLSVVVETIISFAVVVVVWSVAGAVTFIEFSNVGNTKVSHSEMKRQH